MNVTIFSKDRACQLDLLLRSVERFWPGRDGLVVNVLSTASAEGFARGYELVRSLHPEIRFVPERSFREDTLALVDPAQELTVFFVDDDVFRRPFSLALPELDALRRDPELLCCSLRLAPHVDYTYTLDVASPPPPLAGGTWRWDEGTACWSYPMSLDGHVFRTAELRPLLERLPFASPNSLESALAEHPLPAPKGICPAEAIIVNIPANRVQDTHPNRHGSVDAAELNDRFLAGRRLALDPVVSVVNRSVHEELPLEWEPADEGEVDFRRPPASPVYFVKPGYVARERPEYWDDDIDLHGVTWQPDVYADARAIAARLGSRRMIDVGSGNGAKTSKLHPDFEIVGVDFGSNLDVVRERYPFGEWREHDLEREEPLPLSPEELRGAIVICADVAEHLVRPELLLRKLRHALRYADAVLVSTPERDLTRGRFDYGPPPKPHHVREWALQEFAAFLESEGFEHGDVGLTRSNDHEPARHTILGKLFRDEETARRALEGEEPSGCPCPACAALAA